jgi:hypothetical protein
MHALLCHSLVGNALSSAKMMSTRWRDLSFPRICSVPVAILDIFFQSSDADDPQSVMHALELFGTEVLPRIREI